MRLTSSLCKAGPSRLGWLRLPTAKGASVADPAQPFNSSLEGNVRRAIDFKQGVKIDAAALKRLVQAAIALNRALARGKAKPSA